MSRFSLCRSTCLVVLSVVVILALIISGCIRKKRVDDKADAETVPFDSTFVEIVATDSIDVLTLTVANHELVTKQSAMGAFVLSIDGLESGSDCFWLYSINHEMAQEACDKRKVGEGDTVRWMYRCMSK